MKKLLLAGLISSLCSGAAFASDESAIADAKAEKEGVRYNTAIGPYVDPIFDAAVVIVPTWSYEIGDSEKTSQSKLYGIYGTNGNWVLRADTDNYFGKWYHMTQFFYNYAKLDVGNFMKWHPSNDKGPTSEVESTSWEIDNFLGYEISDDLYFGPSFFYSDSTYERGGTPFGTVNMIPDATQMSYGLKGILDKRNHKFRPTDGMYLSFDMRNVEIESSGGAVLPSDDLYAPGYTLNGDTEYVRIDTDFRFYKPLSANTSIAYRLQGAFKGDEAQHRATTLKRVASGFTMEISGKSAYGTDIQVRHYMNDATGFANKLGIVGGLSLAKAIDVDPKSGDDDLHYAVTAGLRYTLNDSDKTAARLDVSYNDQEEDNLVVYFEVNEKF